MKATYHIWMAAAIMSLTASCSSNEEINEPNRQIIELRPIHPAESRVTDTGFESNDPIGVYMVPEGTPVEIGGNKLNNELFTFNGSAWASERTLYWDEGTYDIYAYYPYQKVIDDVNAYEFTIQTDQSDPSGKGYEASDFLWASAIGEKASGEAVSITFQHCMSKVNIKLEKSEDYEGEIPSDCEVFIHNMVPNALIDLNTGSVEASPYGSVKTIKCRSLNTTSFTACVVPQSITSRRPLVEVVTSGVSYMLEGKITLKQGYKSTITVTLSKNPEQVAIEIGGGIDNWENGTDQ